MPIPSKDKPRPPLMILPSEQTAVTAREFSYDIERFLEEQFGAGYTLDVAVEHGRTYAFRPVYAVELLCRLFRAVYGKEYVAVRIETRPSKLCLSVTYRGCELPTPEHQRTLLSLAARADVKLGAKRDGDYITLTLSAPEAIERTTLRAACGMTLYELLSLAFSQYEA